MTEQRKKLRLLPEVLPTPTATIPGRASARARTMAHMQRLVATAAAAGMTMACTREGPGQTGANNNVSPQADGGTSSSGTTTSTTPSSQPTVMPTGYAVVDPLPTPVHCPDVAVLVAASAKFVKGASGAVEAEVTFPPPRRRADVHYDENAKSQGWRVLSTEKRGDATVVRAAVASTDTYGSVTLGFTCAQGTGTLNANLTWTGAPRAGASADVRVTQY